MPQIFTKNTKIKLIEYGSNQQGFEFFTDLKTKITEFLKLNKK